MLQIYMFTTVVFGVMSIAYGLGGKWWWQSLASASAADALQSGRKSDVAAILTSRVLGAAHLLVMGAPSGRGGRARGHAGAVHAAGAGAAAGARRQRAHRRQRVRQRRGERECFDEPPERCAAGGRRAAAAGVASPSCSSPSSSRPPRDAAASVALVPAAAPVPRSRAPAVVPTLSPTNATVAPEAAACGAG